MRKRTFTILLILAAVPVVLGLLYAVAVAISTAKLRQAYAALEADGRPVHVDAVIPPAVPDTENAAPLYQSAISLLEAEPVGDILESRPGGPLDEMREGHEHDDVLGYLGDRSVELIEGTISRVNRRALEALMSRKAADYALFAIERGTQRPACRFPRDYDKGVDLLLPGLNGTRELVRLVGGKAVLEAETGAMDSAWHRASVQARLADALCNEPFLVSQMVRLASIRSSCETIQRLCGIAPPGAEQQERLDALLRGFDDVTPLVRAVDGERLLFGEWLFSQSPERLHQSLRDIGIRRSEMAEFVARLVTRWLTFKPRLLADQVDYVRIMHANAERMEQPCSAAISQEDYGRFTLTGILVPALNRILVIYCTTIAEMRITRAGLALLRYREDHGAFPSTLDVLEVNELTDPFTQGLLHYRTEDDGFTVYSVGEDLQDNGGTPKAERRSSDPHKPRETEHDISWRFPDQTPRAVE